MKGDKVGKSANEVGRSESATHLRNLKNPKNVRAEANTGRVEAKACREASDQDRTRSNI